MHAKLTPDARETPSNPAVLAARQPVPVSRFLTPAFGVLMLLALFVYVWEFDAFQFGYSPDSGDYTLLAHALIKGPTFALHHSAAYPEVTHFPFGYPLLILPFVLFAPETLGLAAWLSLAATLVNGALLFWGWRTLVPGYSDRWRIAVTAMYLLAPVTVASARQVLSEAIFTTALWTAILLAMRLLADPRSSRLWFAFGISVFFMTFTRSIGVVSFACMAAFFLVVFLRAETKRSALLRGAAVSLAAFGILLGAVLALTPVRPHNIVPTAYLDWYGLTGPTGIISSPSAIPPTEELPLEGLVDPGSPPRDGIPRAVRLNSAAIDEHVNRDLRRLLTLTGGGDFETTLAARLNADWLLAVPGLLVLGLLALGNARWWNDTRHRWGITLFQVIGLAYLGIIIPWAGGGERLLYPIQPQLYFALLLGLFTSWQLLLRAWRRIFPSLAPQRLEQFALGGLAVLVCGWLLLAIYRDFTLPTSYKVWGDLTRRTDWVAANLPPDAVLVTDWPVRDFLVTGLETVRPTRNIADADDLALFLRERRITHILLAMDETLEIKGIAPYGDRIHDTRASWQELIARGMLVPIYSDPFPVLVLRVVP